jgi:hypothetical protein
MFRSFANGARAAWGGPLTECSEETASQYLRALRENQPQMAEGVEEQLAWARRRIRRGMPRK